MSRPKIYLAGPSVFYPNSAEFAKTMQDICDDHHAIGLYPLDATIPSQSGPHAKFKTGLAIFTANKRMIDECDAVVADLSPFRGPSADVGTVWELAYAYGTGKIVSAYSYSDGHSTYQDRVISRMPGLEGRDGSPIESDENGDSIEDFDMLDNLMIIGSVGRANEKHRTELLENRGLFTCFERALASALENIRERRHERSR